MVKQKMDSLGSSMAKRHSIGLANLADLVPTSPIHAAKVAQQKHLHSARRRGSFFPADAFHEAPPTRTTTNLKHESVGSTTTKPIGAIADDSDSQIRSAELANVGVGVGDENSSALVLTSGVTATDLFDAIGRDEFFDFMEQHTIELCDEDQDCTVIDGCLCINITAFRDTNHGKTMLHQACKRAHLHVIKCLLFHGACAMEQCMMGRTPFHDVISAGKKERVLVVLQVLYEYEPRGFSVVDTNGTHVVHLAAIHGCLDVLQWCAAVAKTDAAIAMSITSFSGRNVLHYAAYNGRQHVLAWLLETEDSGCPSIASLDVNGYSVLHYAAMGGHLNVCQWLVLDAPSRQDLNIMATNTDGNSALDLAKSPELVAFLEEVSVVPSAPGQVICIGADSSTVGISWRMEMATDDERLNQVFAPKWFEIEYYKKPTGLRRASAMLGLIMGSASAATASASSYLLNWEKVDVVIEADASEYWLTGLDSDCEYLVRVRVLNRNGYSEYSVPDLTTEFRTAGANSSGSPAFIGTLELEILEARRLLTRDCGNGSFLTAPRDATDRGRFFGVVTMQLFHTNADDAGTVHRRTSLSPTSSRSQDHTMESRKLYRLRTDFASVQQDLLLAGSLHAYRHPKFSLRSRLRVPESVEADLLIQVIHETSSIAQSATVGVVRLPFMELVRGFPAKQQWLTLLRQDNSEGCDHSHGELLVRTLFLADGISALPHPTKSGVVCTSAEELLDSSDKQDDTSSPGVNSSPPSSTTSTSSTSTSSSLVSSNGDVDSTESKSLERTRRDATRFDSLGFRVWPQRASISHRSFEYHRLHQHCVARQQEALWVRYHRHTTTTHASKRAPSLCDLLGSSEASHYEPSAFRNSPQLRRLVWDGIPPSSRRALYLRMSGAEAKRRVTSRDHYQQLLKRAGTLAAVSSDGSAKRPEGFDVARRQIQVDLQRTFAGNQSWINSFDGQASMERVLLAYALHNERIGYCQSMSFIVGRLLCLFYSGEERSQSELQGVEEDVFWLLAALCEDYFPKYYTKGMEGLHVDGLVLEMLLPRRLPKVARHFEVVLQNPAQMGLLLVTGWLMPVFCAVFPSETSFRLLDVLFYEGSGAVFSIVIALLRMAQPHLLQDTKDYMQLFRMLKERDQRLHDTALLLEIAHDEHVLLESEYATLRKRCELQYRARQSMQEQTQEPLHRRSKSALSTSVFF